MIVPPLEAGVEEIVVNLVLWLKLVIEATGAMVIGVGILLASLRFIRGSFPPIARDFTDVRSTLARFLAIALEFQLDATSYPLRLHRAGKRSANSLRSR